MAVKREQLSHGLYAVKTDNRFAAHPHFDIEVSADDFNTTWKLLHVCKDHLLDSKMDYLNLPQSRLDRRRKEQFNLAVKWNRKGTGQGFKLYFRNRDDLDAMLMIFAITKGAQ